MASRTKSLLPWKSRYPRRPIARRFRPITMTPKPTPYADWYCEAVAVGVEGDAGACSPGNSFHKPPCGWMS